MGKDIFELQEFAKAFDLRNRSFDTASDTLTEDEMQIRILEEFLARPDRPTWHRWEPGQLI